MLILGIETSCDDTGVALYHSARGLLAHALHSQVALHDEYGGVVPELASRDHIRRVLPLDPRSAGTPAGNSRHRCARLYAGAGAGRRAAGGRQRRGEPRLRTGHPGDRHPPPRRPSAVAAARRESAAQFPFVALLVSGGHTQLMRVGAVGEYELLGETLDDAAGEAFDKTANCSASAIRAGRRSRSWPSRAGRAGTNYRGPCSSKCTRRAISISASAA